MRVAVRRSTPDVEITIHPYPSKSTLVILGIVAAAGAVHIAIGRAPDIPVVTGLIDMLSSLAFIVGIIFGIAEGIRFVRRSRTVLTINTWKQEISLTRRSLGKATTQRTSLENALLVWTEPVDKIPWHYRLGVCFGDHDADWIVDSSLNSDEVEAATSVLKGFLPTGDKADWESTEDGQCMNVVLFKPARGHEEAKRLVLDDSTKTFATGRSVSVPYVSVGQIWLRYVTFEHNPGEWKIGLVRNGKIEEDIIATGANQASIKALASLLSRRLNAGILERDTEVLWGSW